MKVILHKCTTLQDIARRKSFYTSLLMQKYVEYTRTHVLIFIKVYMTVPKDRLVEREEK